MLESRLTTLAIRHRMRWMCFWKGNQPHPEEINSMRIMAAYAMRSDEPPGWEWDPACWGIMSMGHEYCSPEQAKTHVRYYWRRLSEDTRRCILEQVAEWRAAKRAGMVVVAEMP